MGRFRERMGITGRTGCWMFSKIFEFFFTMIATRFQTIIQGV